MRAAALTLLDEMTRLDDLRKRFAVRGVALLLREMEREPAVARRGASSALGPPHFSKHTVAPELDDEER